LHRDDRLKVTVYFEETRGAVEGRLWSGNELVSESETVDDGEIEIDFTASSAGDYLLEVYSDAGDQRYWLDARLTRAFCSVDHLESNNSWEAAVGLTPGSYGELTFCHHNSDWYAVDVFVEERLSFDILAEPTFALDDLVMVVYGPDGGAELEEAPPDTQVLYDSLDDGRVLDSFELEAEAFETYFVHVMQRPGTELVDPLPYTLSVSRALPGRCIDDHFESNDGWETATPIAPARPVVARMCGNDDWYVLDGFEGQTITATLRVDAALSPKPLVAVYSDPEEDPPAPPGSSAELLLDERGPVYLEIQNSGSEGVYLLVIEVSEGDPICDRPDPREEDDTLHPSNPPLEGETFGHLCDGVDHFRHAVEDDENVSVDLIFDREVGTPGLEVLNRDALVIGSGAPRGPSTLRGWVTGDGGSIYWRIEEAVGSYEGPYLIRPTSYGVCATDENEPNDIAADHTLAGATERLSLCPHSDRDYYGIPALAGDRVTARTLIRSGDVTLRLYDPDRNLVMESNRSSPERMKEAVWADVSSSGTWLAEVRGPTPATAEYDIWMNAAPVTACGDTGSNHSFGSALSVENAAEIIGAVVCTGVGDWYITDDEVRSEQTLVIDVSHGNLSEADLDIEIYSDEGIIEASTHTAELEETLEYMPPTDRRVVYRIYIDDGGLETSYDLSTSLR
jgi:hypothetical protein